MNIQVSLLRQAHGALVAVLLAAALGGCERAAKDAGASAQLPATPAAERAADADAAVPACAQDCGDGVTASIQCAAGEIAECSCDGGPRARCVLSTSGGAPP